MKCKIIKLITNSAALAFFSNPSFANELIERNVFNAREDLYLITSTIRPTDNDELFFAVWFMQMETPKDYIEIFDGYFNVIERRYIGEFRSYAYGTAFDCENQLAADLWVQHFSTPTPSVENIIQTEEFEDSFFTIVVGADEKLLDRVCTLGGFQE